MINFFPFLFRFGVSFNYTIPQKIINHLTEYFAEKYDIEIAQSNTEFGCVAVKDNEAKTNASILTSKYKERLKEYNVSDVKDSIFFLDLTRVYSDKFTDYLLPSILINRNNTPKQKFPNYILFLDLLEETSTTLTVLFKIKHSENNVFDNCFIFDKKGQYVDSNLEIKTDNTLPQLIKHLSASTLIEKLEFKLVRKINHFKRYGENKTWKACQQFFYEGVNCQDEAFLLFKEELVRIANNRDIRPKYIVYDSLHSKWLSEVIISVSNTIPSLQQSSFNEYKSDNRIDLRDLEDERNNKDWVDTSEMDIIFISDLINTGSTFKKRIKVVSKKFPKASIYCISTLITNQAYKDFNGTDINDEKQIVIDNQEINFFIQVEQQYYNDNSGENADSCPMCKHELLPLVETDVDVSEKLSSYEMWFMCKEAGYKIEDYQPREDRKNRIVPHSLKLFEKNGALLSLKFKKQLDSFKNYQTDEIVILFPDETQDNIIGFDSSKIEITPSGYFAKRLKLYNDSYTYIPIPRKLIRAIEKGLSWEDIAQQYSKILSQIRNIDSENPIVIIDEANYTGKTFKSIAHILTQQHQEPSCYFPIFNFDAKNTSLKYQNEKYQNVHFLNLYEFTYE